MMRAKATSNLKRVRFYDEINWYGPEGQSPYFIMGHPGNQDNLASGETIAGAGGGY